jgi:triosephosphate isomerase
MATAEMHSESAEEIRMPRKKIVAGNWKMNCAAPDAACELARAVVQKCGSQTAVDVAVCPPFTALSAVAGAVKGTSVALGAQNCYPKDSGAFTGEVDPNTLLAVGCRYVIIGHSERRQYFQETDAFVNQKVKIALEKGLTPIMCCGETLEERESGSTLDVVRRHVEGGLAELNASAASRVVLAYEPVWAIGTGKTAKPEDAQEVHAFIRRLLKDQHGDETAQAIRIQYGGSVKPSNAGELFSQPDIDGGLIGGASLKAEDFEAIVFAAR